MSEGLVSTADLFAALEGYLSVLCTSADTCRRAEDRPLYEKHLAATARMFLALRRDRSLREIKTLVAAERHGYGWSYLSDESGSRAETAFARFAEIVDRLAPTS